MTDIQKRNAAILVLAALSVIIILLSLILILEPENKSDPEARRNNNDGITVFNETKYMIKETGGVIGIYDENGTLIRKINVPVITLPKAEQIKLLSGIKIGSESELYGLIEDYEG